MNARLSDLIHAAETRLDLADQQRLADMVQGFVETHSGDPAFTESERAHLDLIAQEPFDPADPQDIASVFARRG